MKRTFHKIFVAFIALLGILIPAGVAYAQAYGAGNYGACTYGNNCPIASGLLPDTGSLVLILSGLGALIIAVIIFIALARRRKRRRSMTAASGIAAQIPTGTVEPTPTQSSSTQNPVSSEPTSPANTNQPPPPPSAPTA